MYYQQNVNFLHMSAIVLSHLVSCPIFALIWPVTYGATSKWHAVCVHLIRIDHTQRLSDVATLISNDGKWKLTGCICVRLDVLQTSCHR